MSLCQCLQCSIVVIALVCGPPYARADILRILLAETDSSTGAYVEARLAELGHEVTVSDYSLWGDSFDYSPYDVVAFPFLCGSPSDIPHFVDAVDSGEVGAVFFRGGAEPAAIGLGLINGGLIGFQHTAVLDVLDNSHFITSGLSIGEHDLGYTYMSCVTDPGDATTTLADGRLPDGFSGPALVVHNSRRAVITPFYGNPDGYDDENAIGLQITERSLQWAAGTIPEPSSLVLLSVTAASVAAYLWRRRKR